MTLLEALKLSPRHKAIADLGNDQYIMIERESSDYASQNFYTVNIKDKNTNLGKSLFGDAAIWQHLSIFGIDVDVSELQWEPMEESAMRILFGYNIP